MNTTTRPLDAELSAQWSYLQFGASMGATLTHAARLGSQELATAVRTMGREQLEAAATAMAMLHAMNAAMLDPTEDD